MSDDEDAGTLKKLESPKNVVNLRAFVGRVYREADANLGQIYSLMELIEEHEDDKDNAQIVKLAQTSLSKLKKQVAPLVTGLQKADKAKSLVKPKDRSVAETLSSNPIIADKWYNATRGQDALKVVVEEILVRNDVSDLRLFLNTIYTFSELKQIDSFIDEANPPEAIAFHSAVQKRREQVGFSVTKAYAELMAGGAEVSVDSDKESGQDDKESGQEEH